ncbi:MAG: toxin-activating lysine-acyltransferase [Hyphomicrobium sp.]|nr:toxin-activating lysine-acyltransferase [Hyphomicrobium sp.]
MTGDQASGGQRPELAKDELQKRAVVAKQIAASFGEIVTLLMRAPSERTRQLSDLEWMVVPALQTGQFAIADAQSKETGVVMPVGAVMWAFVSDDIDRRMSGDLERPFKLEPNEWRSGANPWIVAAFGDPKVVGGLLQQLTKTVFKDKPAKMRARGADGKPFVGRLEFNAEGPLPSA